MVDPKLYGRYDRHEAVALFGPEAEARNLCDGQWVVFPNVAICFAEVGELPRLSRFTSGGEFCWVADKPYRMSDDTYRRFVPQEVVAGRAGRPIRLFVRPRGQEQYLYIGELESACKFTSGGEENHGQAFFRLSPTLPSAVWAETGGFHSGDLDHAALDAALDRLRRPTTVEERLWVLQRLVTYWHGPIRPEDGFSDEPLEGLGIPDPLRWWYGWAGRRTNVMSGQNFLSAPDELCMRDGLLEFYVENQYCYQWGTRLESGDPPVFGRAERSDPWEPEGITLSEHLILACLFEATMCHSPYGASASWLESSVLDRIVEQIPPIPLNPWRWPEETRVYARGGAFMFAAPNGAIDGRLGYSVWLGAKTEHPLKFLKPFVNESWEYQAV